MLVIFDIDGTLNMTETYGVAAYHKALKQMGADRFTDEQLRDRIGATFTEDVKFFFGEHAAERLDEFSALIGQLWFAEVDTKARLFPGTAEMLRSLKENGHRLAICSNATEEEIAVILKALHVEQEFDYVQGLTLKDTKADSLRVLLHRIQPEQAVMVGDRFYDMQAANGNHIPFIGCLYGYGAEHELDAAQYWVTEPCQIPIIVERLADNKNKASL